MTITLILSRAFYVEMRVSIFVRHREEKRGQQRQGFLATGVTIHPNYIHPRFRILGVSRQQSTLTLN